MKKKENKERDGFDSTSNIEIISSKELGVDEKKEKNVVIIKSKTKDNKGVDEINNKREFYYIYIFYGFT